MSFPRVVASLILVCFTCLPALASQPAERAVNLITDLADSSPFLPGECESMSLEWYTFFGEHPLAPADMLRLEMAIVPFDSGLTGVGLDMMDGPTFFFIQFSDGLVHGVPYRRNDWNDVTVVLRPASQDYVITVNGQEAGPFPFGDFCQDQGGCYSVQALRIHGFSNAAGASAWLDTLALSMESAGGTEDLFRETFDQCRPGSARPPMVGGAGLILTPPKKFHPACRDRS